MMLEGAELVVYETWKCGDCEGGCGVSICGMCEMCETCERDGLCEECGR